MYFESSIFEIVSLSPFDANPNHHFDLVFTTTPINSMPRQMK